MRQAAFCLYLTTCRYKSVRTIDQDTSKGLIDTASRMKAKDQPGAKAAIAKMQEGDKQEAVIIEEIKAYCGKK
jgi:hypothetical protein